MPAPRKFQKPTAARNMTAQQCGNGVRDLASCMRPELQKAPGLDRQERQRNHLGCREECSQRHVSGGRAGKIEMVHRADHAAQPSRARYPGRSRVNATRSATTPSRTKM